MLFSFLGRYRPTRLLVGPPLLRDAIKTICAYWTNLPRATLAQCLCGAEAGNKYSVIHLAQTQGYITRAIPPLILHGIGGGIYAVFSFCNHLANLMNPNKG